MTAAIKDLAANAVVLSFVSHGYSSYTTLQLTPLTAAVTLAAYADYICSQHGHSSARA